MSGMQQMLMGIPGQIAIGQTFNSILVTSGSQTSYLQFKPNGAVHRTRSGALDEYIGNWYNPSPFTNIGTQFFVYFEPIAGSGDGGGAPAPTNVGTPLLWQLLDVERTIGYSGRAFVKGSFRCYIAANVSGAPIAISVTHIGVVWIYP